MSVLERSVARWVLLGVLLLPALALGRDNPCADKRWIEAPVLALGPGEDRGIGGTGRGDDRGIGGTGHLPPEPQVARSPGDHGIGGTGIVGVVSGFASICVNGLEVHFDAATPTLMDGRQAASSVLALGQSVVVSAQGLGGGEYRARNIAVVHTVVGAVEAVNAATDTVRLLGQTVRLPTGAAARVPVGARLAVAGHRLPDGVVLAARVERRDGGPDSVLGTVAGLQADGFRVGDLLVRMGPGAGGRLPRLGEEVLVRGRALHGVLQAEAVLAGPVRALVGPVRALSLQGYVRAARAGGLDVDGIWVELGPAAALTAVEPGSRVQLSGVLRADGRVQAERLQVERPALRDGAGEGRAAGQREGTESAAEPGRTERGATEAERGDGRGAEGRAPVEGRNEAARAESTRADMMRPELQRPDATRPEILRREGALVRPERGGRRP